ncbi:hypothetical protein COLO4_10955 [Corchorus olitorius]|uniref:Uncharacterized protein n=1 Tax=Corchorus olitorius TaxID=93759 RepID=A0A1R3K685_9ROSI|nr:hypothetical protein COLO4_10955 [Corchorus olitorius]
MAAPSVTLKLLIDTENNKVLFAEAGKGFVDFLFNMMLLPVGTFLRLFDEEEDNMGGSLGSLYQSINKLSNDYVPSKEALLNPKVVDDHSISCLTHLLPNVIQSQSSDQSPYPPPPTVWTPYPPPPLVWTQCPPAVRMINTAYGVYPGANAIQHQPPSYTEENYKCSNCNNYFNFISALKGYYHNKPCPSCGVTLVLVALDDKPKSSENGGHVIGFIYLIMDDLAVSPMSIVPTITLLHSKFNIKDVSSTIEERLVDVGRDEALKLLKTSMLSKTVLTAVFLRSNEQQLWNTNQIKSEDTDDFVNLTIE